MSGSAESSSSAVPVRRVVDEDLLAEDDGVGEAAASWTGHYERPWEKIAEDAFGQIVIDERARQSARMAEVANESSRLRLRKGMLRQVYLCLDASQWMSRMDLKPNRMVCAIRQVCRFIAAFFEANSLSQMGLIVCRETASKLEHLCSSPVDLIDSCQSSIDTQAHSHFSLRNSLECALTEFGQLSKSSPSSTLEVLLLCSALNTLDSGDIFETIDKCKSHRVRVSAISLSAEVRIIRHVCDETGGLFSVALSEDHLKQCLSKHIPPPPQIKAALSSSSSSSSGTTTTINSSKWVTMAFPQRVREEYPSLCSCHGEFTYAGFHCPRCRARVCDLPRQCPICEISLVNSPHLLRSYHHLFPVPPFVDVKSPRINSKIKDANDGEEKKESEKETIVEVMNDKDVVMGAPRDKVDSAIKKSSVIMYECFGCALPVNAERTLVQKCEGCGNVFCFECNEFIHVDLHNCPGCLSLPS